MRRIKNVPVDGEEKYVTKFLWFPFTIIKHVPPSANYSDRVSETRWLERATIVYRYTKIIENWEPVRFDL